MPNSAISQVSKTSAILQRNYWSSLSISDEAQRSVLSRSFQHHRKGPANTYVGLGGSPAARICLSQPRGYYCKKGPSYQLLWRTETSPGFLLRHGLHGFAATVSPDSKSRHAHGGLGTPHNGSSLATCGKIVANIISACTSLSPPRSLLKTLRPDSRALFEISADFVERAKNLQLVSFFEMDRTNLGFFKAVVSFPQRISSIICPTDENSDCC